MGEEQIVETESSNYKLIVSYLLGELSSERQRLLEERYFVDPHFLEQIDIIEGDLLNDYVRGTFSDDMAQKFERQLLDSPYKRRKLQAVRDLLRVMDQEKESDRSYVRANATTRWKPALKSARGPSRRIELVLAIVFLLLIGSWVTDRVIMGRRLEQVQKEQAALRQIVQEQQEVIAQKEQGANQDEGPPGQLPEQNVPKGDLHKVPSPATRAYILTFLLAPPVSRTGEKPPKELSIPSQTRVIRLELLYRGKVYPTYRALLTTIEGDEVKSDLRVQSGRSKNVVTVEITASLMHNGSYTLKLLAPPDGQEVGLYNFRISRQ